MTRTEALARARLLPTEAKARLRWNLQRRPSQTPPEGDWLTWLILAGRGFGKTRTGAEWLAEQAWRHPGTRWAIVAATFADARDTCVEGESGLLHALGGEVGNWNRSIGELTLKNGSKVKLFSADEPDRLRGPQHHGAWCDELASWRYPEAWDQLQFGLRLVDGDMQPRTVVTTTPRPTKLVRSLVDRDSTHMTTGSTFENEANLAPGALIELRLRYEGTRLGRQELEAELLTDNPDASWQREWIDGARVDPDPKWLAGLVRVVVGVDPAVTSGEDSDDTGIVTSGITGGGECLECGPIEAPHLFVLGDATCHLSPEGWGRMAVGELDRFSGDRVVGEVNNGGDLVESVIRAVDRDVPYAKVTASRGKVIRAEPIAALYEQGRVHHVGRFDELEDQMCGWSQGLASPDRLDAAVWSMTELVKPGVARTGTAASGSRSGSLTLGWR